MNRRPGRGRTGLRILAVGALGLAAVVSGLSIGRPPATEGAAHPAPPAATGSTAPLRTRELAVRTADGLSLPATLHLPGGRARGPGLVLVHGSGPGPRAQYRVEAEAFARAGVATLTYDKRTVGYSQTERSYAQLADDAVAAADLLRTQDGVAPGQVGLWGLSEGGWVAPLAASRAPDTAFLIVVGGNAMSPLRQQVWAEAVKMQAAGVRGSLVSAASMQTYRFIDGAGLFPEARYDPGPVLGRLRLPVLGIWGALDRSTPPVETVPLFRAGLDRAGNRHYTLRTIGGADHSLRRTEDGFRAEPELVEGYAELVGSWAHAVSAGRPSPVSVTGSGHQHRVTAEVPPPTWYSGANAQLAALGLMVGGFAGLGVGALARRLVRVVRPTAERVRAPTSARVLAGAGLITVVSTLPYLASLAIVRGGSVIDPGPLLAGRPLPWLALQLLAATTAVAAVLLVVRVLRRPPTAGGERIRLGLLLAAAVAFVPWSLYWRLLLP